MICFGPVSSRRLGKSLGINNIIPPKKCSFGCVYCQLGTSVHKTSSRGQFYKPEYIYGAVCRHLESISEKDYPDYLTLVSSGEPTLDTGIGKSIIMLRDTGIKIAVITNGSLLYDKNVREDISFADLVSVKVDTVLPSTWSAINNPVPGLFLERHLNGVFDFSRFYKGNLISETMLVHGLNDTDEDTRMTADFISEMRPSIAYISIPVRPPAEKWVRPPEPDSLNNAWHTFVKAGIKTELLTGFEGIATGSTGNIYEDILNITSVHPLRESSLRVLLRKDNADFSVVESLLSQRLLRSSVYNGERYFIRSYFNHA